jgi:hypothetical protein
MRVVMPILAAAITLPAAGSPRGASETTGTGSTPSPVAGGIDGSPRREAGGVCSNILYGAASGGIAPSTLYAIDPATGAATPVGPSGSIGFINVGAMAFHPVAGVLYGAASTGELITIDPATGVGTLVGPTVNTSTNFGLMDLSFRKSDDALFLVALESGQFEVGIALFEIDVATGYATLVGGSGTLAGGNALAFDGEDTLLHSNQASPLGGQSTLYTMNVATGLSTPLLPLTYQGFPSPSTGQPPRLNAMDFEPETGVLYVSANYGTDGVGDNYLATLDRATGAVVHVGRSVLTLDALAWGNDCGDGDPCTIDRCAAGACTHAAAPDTDGDGLCDAIDNCPGVANPGQENADADGEGNVCDTCPLTANPGQADRDADGQGDACDPCRSDPTDVDSDRDGLCDDGDGSGHAGDASCLAVRLASIDCDDNCRLTRNPHQTDTDRDGLGDVCDACTDTDDDGFGDPGFSQDTCPTDNCPGDASRLVNGDFEIRTLSGWTVHYLPTNLGNWGIDTVGTPVTVSMPSATAPNARGGRAYAVTKMSDSNPRTLALSQSFSVPAGATRVRLSFQMFVNDASGAGPLINPAGLDHTQGPNHHARVDLLSQGAAPFDTGAGVIRNFYLGVDPGPLPNPYTTYEFDITGDVTPGATHVLRYAVTSTAPPLHQGVDNVRITAEVGQPDSDGDGAGDLCDCAPSDASAGRPGTITDLAIVSPGLWTWSELPAADRYHVTRGLLSSLKLGQYGPCFASVPAPPFPLDADDPPLGDGFLYLVQGEDTSCGGLGSLGHASLGDWPAGPSSPERVNLDPLACP